MATTDQAWDGSASRYASTAAYCAACLIDFNPDGEDPVQDMCKLPVREPNGDLNTNALSAAAAALAGARGSGVQAPPKVKKAAARKLLSLYQQCKMTPPASLQALAK